VVNAAKTECQQFVKRGISFRSVDKTTIGIRNRCVFVSSPKLLYSSELAALVAGDRLFQARAAATGNFRLPMVESCVDGIFNVMVSVERRQRRAASSANSIKYWRLSPIW